MKAERLRVWKIDTASLMYFEKKHCKNYLAKQPSQTRVYTAAERNREEKSLWYYSCQFPHHPMHANHWMQKAEDLPAILHIYYFVIAHFSHETKPNLCQTHVSHNFFLAKGQNCICPFFYLRCLLNLQAKACLLLLAHRQVTAITVDLIFYFKTFSIGNYKCKKNSSKPFTNQLWLCLKTIQRLKYFSCYRCNCKCSFISFLILFQSKTDPRVVVIQQPEKKVSIRLLEQGNNFMQNDSHCSFF